jgi:hypothetical protein
MSTFSGEIIRPLAATRYQFGLSFQAGLLTLAPNTELFVAPRPVKPRAAHRFRLGFSYVSLQYFMPSERDEQAKARSSRATC